MGARIHVVSRTEYYDILNNGVNVGPMAPVAMGESVYNKYNCNTCHSNDGSQKVGPTWQNLWGAQRPGSASGVVDEAYIVESILYPQAYIVPGYEGANMPSYDGQLDEVQVARRRRLHPPAERRRDARRPGGARRGLRGGRRPRGRHGRPPASPSPTPSRRTSAASSARTAPPPSSRAVQTDRTT